MKRHNTFEVVSAKLRAFAENSADPGHARKFTFELIKGNTRDTLPSYVADFVYIDGGHSVATIRSDYEAVKGSHVIVFDDYYRPDAKGGCPDLKKFGANAIVDAIDGAEVFDSTDPVTGGGYVCFAVVRDEGDPYAGNPARWPRDVAEGPSADVSDDR